MIEAVAYHPDNIGIGLSFLESSHQFVHGTDPLHFCGAMVPAEGNMTCCLIWLKA
jgi:hypothetical protein